MSYASDISANAPVNAPADLVTWVAGVAELTRPDRVEWCDGSIDERDRLTARLVESGTFIKLNEEKRPHSFLVRSHPSDVGPVAARTFVCAARPEDVGPTNHWADPDAMKQVLAEKFAGSMRGRTMYVVPFSMGPAGSAMCKLGIEITDSPYVVVATRILADIGTPALNAIAHGGFWAPAVHSVGYPLRNDDGVVRSDAPWPCNPDKYIAHFPETGEIWSYGSGHGDNALLSHRSYGLRLASVLGEEEGWLAEHMRLVKLTSPDGQERYVAAAFAPGCSEDFAEPASWTSGWRAEPISGDVAWLGPHRDGRLRAVNPERGCLGATADVSPTKRPAMLDALASDAIFTDVALTDDGDVWWEGLTAEPPARLADWRGHDWTPESGAPAAHPLGTYLVSADRIQGMAKEATEPDGVPIDAIVFGGRRASVMPLVTEAYSWEHGVFLGATLAYEKTGADGASETVRDPFAMLSYCGYNLADYWTHWLRLGRTLGDNAPRIFAVNWFRQAADGTRGWPRAEKSRLVEWMLRRVAHEPAVASAFCGRVPLPDDIDVDGMDITVAQAAALFDVDPEEWVAEADAIGQFFALFGNKLPAELTLELADLRGRIAAKKLA